MKSMSCRQLGGACDLEFRANTFDDFQYLEGVDLIASYVQTPDLTRRFCSNCGSNLPLREVGDPFVGIPAGLLDDDPGAKSSEHIYVGSKARWWDIAGDIAQYEEASPSAL